MYEVGRDIIKNAGASGGAGAGAGVVGRTRLRFVYGLFVVAFIVFAGKTLWLGIEGTDRARRGYGAGEWVGVRADIVDRNGILLAKNTISGHIVLRPPQVRDRDAVASFVHQIAPDISVQKILDDINSGKKFIYVKKLASDYQRKATKEAKIAGLSVDETEWRRYPKRRLFSHVIGFVGNDGYGLEGVERIRDEYLRNNTAPLVLSLDSRIQAIFYEELSISMQKYGAHAAMGMLMNSRTGEMIAMVALPDYDPENLDMDPQSNRLFSPLRCVFEMGSIFKIFNTAMAMEAGIANKEYFVAKPYAVRDSRGRVAATIRDVASFKPPRPNLNVSEILLHSCNAGSVQIALDLPDGAQASFMERIHMSVPLDLEFGRTERSLMPYKWGPVEKATVSFGHGISVTPMHLLLGVNAMTNGGFYIWPTFFKRNVGAVAGERVVSPEISENLRKIMHKIAEETTARKARIAGINIGGKTATAEKRVNGKIDTKKNLTAFVGIFPVESPQYIILIVLDEPKGTQETFGFRTAAWNAVPTAGAIMEQSLPLLF